jgi:WD40 repeat protein
MRTCALVSLWRVHCVCHTAFLHSSHRGVCIVCGAGAHKGSHASSRAVATRHGQVSVFEVVSGGGGGGGAPSELRLAMSVAGHARGISAVSFAQDCVHLGLACKDGTWSVIVTSSPSGALKSDPIEHARGTVPGYAPERSTSRPQSPRPQSPRPQSPRPQSPRPQSPRHCSAHVACAIVGSTFGDRSAPFEAITLSPFAKRLVGGTASTLTIVDVAAAARGQSARAVIDTIQATAHGGITGLSYSSDGLRALSAGEDGRLRLWVVETDEGKAGTL